MAVPYATKPYPHQVPAELLQTNTSQVHFFSHTQVCKNYKTITSQTSLFRMFSCKQGHTSDSNIQRITWWIIIVKITLSLGERFGFFFLLGESEVPGGEGGFFFIGNPQRGGPGRSPGQMGGGVEWPGGCLWGILGWGLNIFFRGQNSHQLH